MIDGIPCGHHFFSDPWDITFRIMHNDFQIYKCAHGSSASCTPTIALTFNIDQLECTHLPNVIPICLIPGPKAPQDLNSFIRPLIDECKQLVAGIHAFDSRQDEGFVLHAYLISAHGDMHAMKHLLCLKGHNGICPCRMCKIQAIRDVTGGGMTYYVPLRQPHQRGLPASSWDPRCLPYSKQKCYQGELEEIKSTSTKKRSKELSQRHGLNGKCSLLEIPSLRWAVTFPHDFMHLMFENHFKNKIHMWSGNYKALSSVQKVYEIKIVVWEQIGCK